MRKVITNCSLLAVIAMSILCLASCNGRPADTPFPISDSVARQPAVIPFKFSAPKKINWITTKTGGVPVIIKKFDLETLPATPYDTGGFKPLPAPPDVKQFTYNTLPDTILDIAAIPSKPLKLKTYVLEPPVNIKSSLIIPKAGTKISLSDIGLAYGLTEKATFALLKDSKGFIWIGTERGLYRYDGENMQFYSTNNSPVIGLAEDRQGKIWVVDQVGMGMFDPSNGVVSITNEIFLGNGEADKLTVDHEGMIWLPERRNAGIFLIDPVKKVFRHLDRKNGLSGSNFAGVLEDKDNNIWLSNVSNGADIINPERNKVRHLRQVNGLKSDSLRSMTTDTRGNVWIASKHSGISSVNIKAGTIKNYAQPPGSDFTEAFRIAFDDKNRLWCGGNRGVLVFDTAQQRYRIYGPGDDMPSDFYLDLVHDNQQRTWLATYASGLMMIEQNGEEIHPVNTKSLSTLFEDSLGRVWVGSGLSTLGIEILDGQKKLVRRLNKSTVLGDNFIQNIMQTNGKIIIATDGGVDWIDPTKKTINHLGQREGLANDTIYGTVWDRKGNLWVAGPSAGIDFISADHQTIMHAGTAQGMSDNNISDLKEDRQGRIWVATFNKGIDIIDPKSNTVQNLREGAGLKDSSNRMIIFDSLGRVWIGTDKGVYFVDEKNNTLLSIDTAQGLSDQYVVSLLPYKGKMVAGTQNKVNIISPPESNGSNSTDSKWRVSLLEGSEGLIDRSSANNNWNTNIITSKGQYLWATGAGITVVNGINEQPGGEQTFITGMSIVNHPQFFANTPTLGDKDTIWAGDGTSHATKGRIGINAGFTRKEGATWDSVTGPYNTPVNLVLPYDQNYMQFTYAQAHLGRKELTKYSYILEGIDKNWNPVTSKTATENYLNLPAGQYVFKVRSKDLSGKWTKPAVLSFTITPPWWKTWWMYLVYIAVIVGGIFAYIKYRSAALLKENRRLEEKIEARTAEVKQQAQELSTVNEISQALVGQADVNELIELVGNKLRDLFNANIVYIALLDKKTKMISFPYQHGDNMAPLKLGEGLTSKIILSGEPLLLNKDVHEVSTATGMGRVGLPAASYLGVPIPVADEIIGVLSIQSTEMESRFAEKDQHLLSTIAANVGVAIRKARLFEEVKQANTDADAARKSAEEANAAKSAFLSTVSHELRTPLTSVLGFAKIIKKRLEEKVFPVTDKSDPKIAKTVEQISANLQVVISEGERLTNLINDVLDLAKIEAGKMEWNLEPVKMPEVVDRAIAATSSLFDQKNLKLDKIIEDNLPEISGDRDKLIQVVVNLLSNAVKFTKEGAVTCRVFQKDGGIVVGITDTGIGIAPEDHDKVFEQFKQVGDTLTDKPKGTGLGLPICKEIVEHHDGKIWLESELGHGSTFYFMVPIIKADEQVVNHMQLEDLLRQLKRRMKQSHPEIQGHANATILVVDDDDGIRSLLKQELTEAGYHVEEAANGKQAVEKIRASRPDLVLLDVMMPEMNGFDVAAILKNDPQTMEIPIIILSIVQDKARGFRIGVDRYLTKPIDTQLLFSEIGNLLEQGKSRKKVMVVDEDSVAVRSLTDVLQAKGYQVVESDGKELIEKAIAAQPDIIILNSLISDNHEIVKTLRFEKGLENVLFLIYQ